MKETAETADISAPIPEAGTSRLSPLLDHLFRHEAGRMVSALTRVFGLQNLDLAEDAVQEALIDACKLWPFDGIPGNPTGWLYVAAKHKALNILRREQNFRRFSPDVAYLLESEATAAPLLENLFLPGEIEDDLLRMIFACCHPSLTAESQVALTLKTLCGFGIREIAGAFLTSEATVEKRILRAKEKLRSGVGFEVPSGGELEERLKSVEAVLYLLFNEGYQSSSSPLPIRRDLCLEALRLAKMLTEHPAVARPSTFALTALMCFHAARLDARLDDNGYLLLLKYQDRSRWNRDMIQVGFHYLKRSHQDPETDRYQLEASIACFHCLAPSYAETDWRSIRALYDRLAALLPTPVVALNRAIAVGQDEGPTAGLAAVEAIADRGALENYPWFYATLGELHLAAGNKAKARVKLEKALTLIRNPGEKKLFREKLRECGE